MPFTKMTIFNAATLLFLAMPSVLAMPAVDTTPSIRAYVRDANFAFHDSVEMARDIVRREAALPIHKRSSAKVQACYDAGCTDCHTVFDSSFTSNSACIVAEDTGCLLVSNLDDANIAFWNHAGCNGNESKYGGCPAGTNAVGASGTNSIGIHTGC